MRKIAERKRKKEGAEIIFGGSTLVDRRMEGIAKNKNKYNNKECEDTFRLISA
jgi:hypothetical protein